MNRKERVQAMPQRLLGLVSLAIAMVVSRGIAARAVREFPRANDLVQVTGSARRAITSDYIIWYS